MAHNIRIESNIASFDAKLDLIKGNPRTVRGSDGSKHTIQMKDGRPVIKYKAPVNGEQVEVTYTETDLNGNPLQGRSSIYMDADQNKFTKQQCIPFYLTEDENYIPARPIQKSTVFKITSFEPRENYYDKYQMEKYYQVRPSAGNSKNQIVKLRTQEMNILEMKKLWDSMIIKEQIAKGKLNLSNVGFLNGVGYLRPVLLNDPNDPAKQFMTFEMAFFREEKIFTWTVPTDWRPTSESHPTNGHSEVNAGPVLVDAVEVDEI